MKKKNICSDDWLKLNSVGITLATPNVIKPIKETTLLKKKDILLFSANDIIIYLFLSIKVYY
tara:strand:+ start:274 stop:459 length:186 start_codon:yes stop_codon:yes gene_type:complete